MTALTEAERACLLWVHEYGLEHGRGPTTGVFNESLVRQLANRGLLGYTPSEQPVVPEYTTTATPVLQLEQPALVGAGLYVTPLGLALLERAETSGNGAKEDVRNKHAENLSTADATATAEVRSGMRARSVEALNWVMRTVLVYRSLSPKDQRRFGALQELRDQLIDGEAQL